MSNTLFLTVLPRTWMAVFSQIDVDSSPLDKTRVPDIHNIKLQSGELDELFKHLLKFDKKHLQILTLLVSQVVCKSSFSTLKIIKICNKIAISSDNLNHVMLMAVEQNKFILRGKH